VNLSARLSQGSNFIAAAGDRDEVAGRGQFGGLVRDLASTTVEGL
jgi:hypothetical protein